MTTSPTRRTSSAGPRYPAHRCPAEPNSPAPTSPPGTQPGSPAIPAGAHIRLASSEHNGGTRILRRGYSFTDGIDPQAGTLLGGLFFIAFMKNPAQFIRLQQALAADALNEYIHHTGSAVFACPPGLRPGQHWGGGLFT